MYRIRGAVDIVEVDPRMTKDGVIVLMHDETIDRTTTGKGKVKDLTYEQLQSYRLKLADGTVTNHTVPLCMTHWLQGGERSFLIWTS